MKKARRSPRQGKPLTGQLGSALAPRPGSTHLVAGLYERRDHAPVLALSGTRRAR